MKKQITTLILAIFFLVNLVTTEAGAQEFLLISDIYSCGRLGDGKLYLVRVNSEGFTIIKKGAANKAYDKEVKINNQRIKTLNNAEKKLRKGNLSNKDGNKLNKVLEKIDNELIDGILDDKILAKIENGRNRLKVRNQLIKTWKAAIKSCEKQKYPGLNNISAIISAVVLPGRVSMLSGVLIQIPKPNAKSQGIGACLVQNIPGGVSSVLVSFTNNICSSSFTAAEAGVYDCTGPIGGGLLAYYSNALSSPNGSEAFPERVQNGLAFANAKAASANYRVIPVSAAPGRDCKRITN